MSLGYRAVKWLPIGIGLLLLLALFGGYFVDVVRLNAANIQTMKANSLQFDRSVTDWGSCRQAHVHGRHLLLQRMYNEALPYLQEAAACSDDSWAWFDLGQAQYALGDLGSAADSWRHSEEGYEQAVRLASMAMAEGDEGSVVAAWEFAAEVNPAEQIPYIQLARLAADSEPEGVVPLLQEAIAADPDTPTAYIELGRYYQEAGDAAEAQRYFEQAHVLAPGEISLLVALAENAAVLDDVPAAIEYWQEVALRNERRRAMAYFRIGELALNDGNFSSALAFFGRAAEIEPENPQYMLGLARAYFELGCKGEATDAYQAVMAAAESEAVLEEAREKLADLAVMTTDSRVCRN